MRNKGDRGGIGLIIFLILAGAGIYVGFAVGKLYFDQSSLENEVRVVANQALTQPRTDVPAEIAKLLVNYDVKIPPETITVEPGKGRLSIAFAYQRPADLILTRVPMHFNIYVQVEGGRSIGLLDETEDRVNSGYRKAAERVRDAPTQ